MSGAFAQFHCVSAPVFLTKARVAARVAQGGHAIPEDVIRRRFTAGLRNFHSVYKVLVNGWTEYDNSGLHPVQVGTGENHVNANRIQP